MNQDSFVRYLSKNHQGQNDLSEPHHSDANISVSVLIDISKLILCFEI